MKKLIVNADDYGFSEAVTLGILRAHRDGIVTSTTIMMNMPYAKTGIKYLKNYPNLGTGVHLNITIGKPLIDGDFPYLKDHQFTRNVDYKEVNKQDIYNEWDAQIQLFIKLVGHKPDHLDSHHHVHVLPELIDIVKELADKYDIPVRQKYQDYHDEPYFIPSFTRMFDVKRCYEAEVLLEGEVYEQMCHPGYVDAYVMEHSSYNIDRCYEIERLTSNEIKELFKNVELITYRDLESHTL